MAEKGEAGEKDRSNKATPGARMIAEGAIWNHIVMKRTPPKLMDNGTPVAIEVPDRTAARHPVHCMSSNDTPGTKENDAIEIWKKHRHNSTQT